MSSDRPARGTSRAAAATAPSRGTAGAKTDPGQDGDRRNRSADRAVVSTATPRRYAHERFDSRGVPLRRGRRGAVVLLGIVLVSVGLGIVPAITLVARLSAPTFVSGSVSPAVAADALLAGFRLLRGLAFVLAGLLTGVGASALVLAGFRAVAGR